MCGINEATGLVAQDLDASVVEALRLVGKDTFIIVVAITLQFQVWCNLRRILTFLNKNWLKIPL